MGFKNEIINLAIYPVFLYDAEECINFINDNFEVNPGVNHLKIGQDEVFAYVIDDKTIALLQASMINDHGIFELLVYTQPKARKQGYADLLYQEADNWMQSRCNSLKEAGCFIARPVVPMLLPKTSLLLTRGIKKIRSYGFEPVKSRETTFKKVFYPI